MTANTFGLPAPPPAPAAVGSPATAPAEPRKTFGYKLVFALWLLYMFEPQTYLANTLHLPVIGKLLLVLICLLALNLLLRPPRRAFLLPFGVIAIYALVMSFFAANTTYARGPAMQAVLFYVCALGFPLFVKTPKQFIPMLALFMVGQFIWWAPWGLAHGSIGWHGEYANSDGYGPLMDFGMAAAFPYGLATRNRRTRLIAFGVGALCMLGLVSSFARGAFLAGVAVLGWLWLNAPRKGAITGFIVVCAIAIVVGSQLFTGKDRDSLAADNFLDEITTIFNGEKGENTSDNSNGRGVLWDAAVKVWKENPVLGVGARNFGIYAAAHLRPDELGGDFQRNPSMMYDAAIHNMFYQVLCEYGIVGLCLHLWLFVDFFRRNHRLRSPAFGAAWVARGGGAVDLKWVSIGLTGMMIAVLANGWFYNVLQLVFIPTVVLVNAMLYQLARPMPGLSGPSVRRAYR